MLSRGDSKWSAIAWNYEWKCTITKCLLMRFMMRFKLTCYLTTPRFKSTFDLTTPNNELRGPTLTRTRTEEPYDFYQVVSTTFVILKMALQMALQQITIKLWETITPKTKMKKPNPPRLQRTPLSTTRMIVMQMMRALRRRTTRCRSVTTLIKNQQRPRHHNLRPSRRILQLQAYIIRRKEHCR